MWGDTGRYRAACAASAPSSQTNSSSSRTPLWSLSAWLGVVGLGMELGFRLGSGFGFGFGLGVMAGGSKSSSAR